MFKTSLCRQNLSESIWALIHTATLLQTIPTVMSITSHTLFPLHPFSSWPLLYFQENLSTSMEQSSAWWLDLGSNILLCYIYNFCISQHIALLSRNLNRFAIIYAGEKTFHIFFPAAYDTASLLPEYAFSLSLNLCQGVNFKNMSTYVFCLLSDLTAPLISVHAFRSEIFWTLGQQLLVNLLCALYMQIYTVWGF